MMQAIYHDRNGYVQSYQHRLNSFTTDLSAQDMQLWVDQFLHCNTICYVVLFATAVALIIQMKNLPKRHKNYCNPFNGTDYRTFAKSLEEDKALWIDCLPLTNNFIPNFESLNNKVFSIPTGMRTKILVCWRLSGNTLVQLRNFWLQNMKHLSSYSTWYCRMLFTGT